MPQEIFPSSYVCDCGLQSDHFENTIRDLKELSMKRPQTLIAEDDAHEIIFGKGEFIAMWCPLEERELAADPSGSSA